MSNPEAPEFEIVDLDADHVKATAFNMLFAVWRFHTRYEPYRRCLHWSAELAKHHPEGIGVMHLVEATATLPDAATRRLFNDGARHDAIRHYSVVHTARGFKAASIRAIVAGSFAIARPRAAHSVHASLGEAATWHAEQQRRIGRSESAEQLASIVESLRQLHAERHSGELYAP
jgi:hypothetical protein